MERWITYQKERFPLVPNLLIAFGFSAQAAVIAAETLDLALVLTGSLMPLLFFAVLRLMDEVKDVAKDRVAHPERPLARGLIALDEARRGIIFGVFLMSILAAVVAGVYGPLPGLLYGFTTGYLWLMYKEFFIGTRLNRMPLLYAATHQIVILPLAASAAALAPQLLTESSVWMHLLLGGLQILPAFFTYEVARKLKPGAHPILETYREVYGLKRCQIILAGLAMFSFAGLSLALHAFPFVHLPLPWTVGLIGGFVLAPFAISLLKGDAGAKAAEGLATLNLLVAMYAPVLAYGYLKLLGGAL